MAVLILSLAGVALVTGCYSPELRDCAVSCVTSSDCAPDQVCGSDRMCAAPALAGRCAGSMLPIDAAVDAPITIVVDAPMVDAAPPIDASTARFLVIENNGRGGVAVAGIGICHHTSPTHPCTFEVVAGVLISLEAVADSDYRFDKWESGPCIGQDETCSLAPLQLVTEIKVKFRQDDD
ncbi:MAG: hypothetical protein H0T42_14330 [Deltaproteobacteria bacterium]|nr:hypothetical protein [Deltaproteobacteria bacterium]